LAAQVAQQRRLDPDAIVSVGRRIPRRQLDDDVFFVPGDELDARGIDDVRQASVAAAKQISLVTTLSPALPPVAADRERVLQVFSNLGGNALKFTPEHGRVEIHATGHDSVVEFVVRDTGPGIASEELPHVFDRFYASR
jgi:signal transduction histidine kinase